MPINVTPEQAAAIRWAIDHPFCGLFMPTGSGKTLSTLLAISEIGEHPWLIIAPPTVAKWTWKDEVAKWNLPLRVLSIDGTPAQRKKSLTFFDADIYTISSDLFSKAYLNGLLDKFKYVVVDEVTMFRTTNSTRHRAMWKMRKQLKRLIGLTGTPTGNRLESVFGLMKLIDPDVFGKVKTKFLDEYFIPGKMVNNVPIFYTPKPGAKEKIKDKMATVAYTCPPTDKGIQLKVIDSYCEMTPTQYKLYSTLKKKFIAEVGTGTITAETAAILSNKLCQMANGIVYDSYGKEQYVHGAKWLTAKDLLRQADDNVLVAYHFKSEKKALLANKQIETFNIEKWNRREQQAALIHPASCGYGLNLQSGGSILVWYGLTWNFEQYHQTIERLYRNGQIKDVRVYRIITRGTIDERIIKCLGERGNLHDSFMNAIMEEIRNG